MVDSRIQNREDAYRGASRTLDYFVTGLAAVLFVFSLLCVQQENQPVATVLNVTSAALFALATLAGLRKLEYYVALLGTEYTIRLAEMNQAPPPLSESAAVLDDLTETVEKISSRASFAHLVRSWLLVLAVLALVLSRVLLITD